MAPCPSAGRGEGVGEEAGEGVVTGMSEEVATGVADGVDVEDAVCRGEGVAPPEQPTTKTAISGSATTRRTRVARPRDAEAWVPIVPSPSAGLPGRPAIAGASTAPSGPL